MSLFGAFWPLKMVICGGNVFYIRIDGLIFGTFHEDVYGI